MRTVGLFPKSQSSDIMMSFLNKSYEKCGKDCGIHDSRKDFVEI